jgi:predicted anti-sigma-YlaC factor YlaD
MDSAGWVIGWLGLAVYLTDMIRLFHDRKRRKMELNARMARWALASLGMVLIATLYTGLFHQWQNGALPLIFLWLFGWIGGLGLTQLYKIVPFLTWLAAFVGKMGRQRTPKVQDLVREGRDAPAFSGYFAAAAAGTIALAAGWPLIFQVAMAVMFLSTLDIARALWHASAPGRASVLPAARKI